MDQLRELRHYKRSTVVFFYKALVSAEGLKWEKVDVNDLSAGGLSFFSSNSYDTLTPLSFNIYLFSALSEFYISIEGLIARKEQKNSLWTYGVKFTNMSNHLRVQIDEMINSKVAIGL